MSITPSMELDRPPVRLLHTSDLHLGDDINPDGRHTGLRAIVDTALAKKIDVVLIAGDFFDNARVKEEAIEHAITELSRLTMPTVVIPGNHDCLGENSIYARADLSKAGSHVHFVDSPDGNDLLFDDLHLRIWGKGIEDHHPGHKPLEGYRSTGNGYWQVVVTHGHFVPSDETSYRSSPILEDEIATLGCDYLALGHWHRFLDLSANGVTAYYSGSPSEAGSGIDSVNIVNLDPLNGVLVERFYF
ncbi:DNA repair exonuclease [Dehalococcoidia bacterium]|nr:DNA repair exonuclease [Dehalococcoidia bacterium]